MVRIYIRFSGFIIRDPRIRANNNLSFTLINNATGTQRTTKFTMKEARTLRKYYHIDIDSFSTHTFSVLLNKHTGLFGKQQVARLDIPTFVLPMDKMSMNYLQMNTGNVNNPPIICKCVLHLQDRTQPFKAQAIKPTLPQADYDDVCEIGFNNEFADYNDYEAPLLI
ncbi:hypothetical protein TVAG_429350 [Trichomonas vaginalis G3]|uniref:Uncharacterized protein n=1 Tax=Trichomonas vaginalis (strain ATCC PRA-98 / G3) TaxID=412133 RepID=A2F953_TRIV3|nr:hypothetical protein TVAGG3_0641730 [Trichomonas vaginalis G3]EAX98581.1 hypothetical protein TVAG_429350 [Trichomonas vaginalis G3]KAI5505220.1 hypothetical protein TVAGG3_0641730 [Trichomonas vaginalis G3]|eukprot:XP_001311511.1 hypothetical protein [Trichomonas vaginalis G3]